ncbi:hypothetical protein B0H13DRAFT_1879320 [Mycena leptocephala]|nr:hypothetical protein B0H13DRAFT_1879320 [Mycena leptocephala]
MLFDERPLRDLLVDPDGISFSSDGSPVLSCWIVQLKEENQDLVLASTVRMVAYVTLLAVVQPNMSMSRDQVLKTAVWRIFREFCAFGHSWMARVSAPAQISMSYRLERPSIHAPESHHTRTKIS